MQRSTVSHTLRLVVLLLAVLASADMLTAQSLADKRTVQVTGQAEVRVVPNEAIFNFGIETSDMEVTTAQSENERRVKALLALAGRLGIEERYVQTDYLSIEPRYEYPGNYNNSRGERQFLGYFTTRNVMITLRDLSKFQNLLVEALKLGVNHVGQAQLRTTELRKYRDEARLQAIRAAREKAAALAGELGMKLGKPISISESIFSETPWRSQRNAMMQNSLTRVDAPEEEGSSTLAPGEIAISAVVSVTFEME